MCLEIIKSALDQGAKIYASISGGKDGEAMVRTLFDWQIPVEGFIHADLGRVEWKQSMEVCKQLSSTYNTPLYVVRRSDGADLLEHWKRRLDKLRGTGKPFWSSPKNRYCTSDLKVAPINRFFTSVAPLIISAEGIRAQESKSRMEKSPLTIRWSKTSSFYRGMTVEEAIRCFRPEKRLTLTWYPIFNFSLDDVLKTAQMNIELLEFARLCYKLFGKVVPWWPFHPAYVFGNQRVSCMICILASLADIQNGARHNPELLQLMISMEQEGRATFRPNMALTALVAPGL